MAEDAGSLDRGRFRYFPVAPGRMEFAIEVRRALLDARPGVVAVELPAAPPSAAHERYLIEVARITPDKG